jgi:DNA polymerase V
VLEKTVLELRGTVCMDVDHEPAPQQQMMCSRSFGAAVTDLSELVEVVSQFATRVAEKARLQAAVAGAVPVFITTSPYRQNDRQHSPCVTVPLVRPSADTRVIVAVAVRAVRQNYRAGFSYAKAGVMLVDLRPQKQHQSELDLFGDSALDAGANGQESPRQMEAVDKLNRSFGKGAVTVASAQHQRRHDQHAGRQLRRTPRYTTRLGEIATAHA